MIDMPKQRIKFIYELLKDASAAYPDTPIFFFQSALITPTEHRDDEISCVLIILSLDHALDLTLLTFKQKSQRLVLMNRA